MKTAVYVLMLSILLWNPAICSAEGDLEIPGSLTTNVWIGKGGPDDIVFKFWVTEDGSLTGEAHTIRGGKHMTQSPAIRVMWKDPEIEIHMNTGVIFQGSVNSTRNEIDGRLIYQGKQLMKLPLTGIDPSRVKGLSARPPLPAGDRRYSYTLPIETGDGWQPANPEMVGLSSARMESLVTDVVMGKAGLLHSLLIVCQGKLVLEEYFHGYKREDLHRLASVTKSISSLITGIAVDMGKIKSVDTPLIDFFPQHREVISGEWKNVTLRHLLTMSIGTAWSEEEADRTHGAGDDFFKMLLSRDFTHKPGTQWQYVSANVNLLGGVIKNATGMHADEFSAVQLFAPLRIENWNWDYGMVDGYRLMDGSLMLRPRSMAKLGALVANRGSWNGKQVVSARWIKESTSPGIIPSENASEKYGYLWWLFYLPSSIGIQEAVVANGKGSQFIIIFPSLELVVVTTGSNDENGMQFAIGKLLSEHILSQITKPLRKGME